MKKINIVLILGLPGSGKTFFSKKMQNETPNSLLLDDYSVNYSEGVDIPSNINKLIVTDPMFLTFSYETITSYFIKKYSLYSIIFEWIIFTLDVSNCLKNVNSRNDGRIISNYFINNLYVKSKNNFDNYVNSITLHNESLEIKKAFNNA